MHPVESIQKIVAAHYRVRFSDLMGRERRRAISRPRQVAMKLATEFTKVSKAEVARRFQRDHTTLIVNVRRVEVREKLDPQTRRDLEELRLKINEEFGL